MPARRDYWTGIWLTGLGAIILSPDSLLFRLLDGPLWTSAFWRLLLMGSAICLWLAATRRRRLLDDIRAIGSALPIAIFAMGVCNLAFLYALTETTAANVLALIATAPVFTAIFGLAIGERPPLRTWLAAGGIAVGVAVILDAGLATDGWRGILAAGLVAIFVGIYFTVGRARSDVDMTPALGLSALVSAGVAGAFAGDLAPPPGDWPLLLALGLCILPISLSLITLGPRRLPAAEVSLLLLLETALGPVWVWVGLGEVPSNATILGGGLILAALVLHSLDAWRVERRRPRAA